jgi:flagellar motility protein MotE (MotC chaperone)
MKIAGIIILVIALLGCAAGLVLMSRSLGATNDRLEDTQTALAREQAERQDIAQSLESTRDELQDTAASLQETRADLEEQRSQTDKYVQLYETSAGELEKKESDLAALEDRLASLEQENEGLQATVAGLEEKLALYEDTLGTHVYSGVTPPYHSGNVPQIILINQASAEDPTWEELLAFLKEDKTDKNLYVPGEYECGNFAQDLHNNAEARGIRCAFVAVHFYDAPAHALNAFKATDRGLVYIDDTGDQYRRYAADLDKLVELSKDEVYSPSFLFPDYIVLIPQDMKVKSIEIYW